MNIGYCNHHCNKEAILVYNDMAFDAFHFFIAVNSALPGTILETHLCTCILISDYLMTINI